MGYIESSDSIIKQTTDALDNILRSKASIYLSGAGDPVLVTWWNMNDSISTVDNGTGTVDALLGKESPFRYNKIEGLPAYGIMQDLKNIEMAMDDNGMMDMQLEIEPILLPNTIIPGPYDYMEYKFSNGRNIFFMVNNVQINSLMSNGYYKVPMHLVDIDSKDYPNGIEEITVKTMKVKLDNIGSNEKCVISDKVFDDISEIENIVKQAVSDYIDTFFVRRYNSFIFSGYGGNESNIIYDPYLTKFITNNSLLDAYDELLQPIIMEQDENFRSEYNKTFFRAVELRDKQKIKPLSYEKVTFTKKHTNPFQYWGDEFVYLIKIYKDEEIKFPRNRYLNFDYLYHMSSIQESNKVTIMENILIRYFQRDNYDKFLSLTELKDLKNKLEVEHNEYYFYLTPVILYILLEYKNYLNNSIL